VRSSSTSTPRLGSRPFQAPKASAARESRRQSRRSDPSRPPRTGGLGMLRRVESFLEPRRRSPAVAISQDSMAKFR